MVYSQEGDVKITILADSRAPEGLTGEHDLSMWVDDDGLVVCVGCSRAGIINVLNHDRRLNDGPGIREIVGCVQLQNASTERPDRTVAAACGRHDHSAALSIDRRLTPAHSLFPDAKCMFWRLLRKTTVRKRRVRDDCTS